MMLISRKSRRKSDLFESRFRDGSGVDFPLRQYLRCKEEFYASFVHFLVLGLFAVILCIFSVTLNNIFLNHGADLKPMYRWLALGLMVVFVLSVIRRLFFQVQYMRELRVEMQVLQSEFRNGDD